MINFCLNKLIQSLPILTTVLCRILATTHISHGMPMLKRKKNAKKFQAHAAKLSTFKMATMSAETYFLFCASTSAFDVGFIFLMPLCSYWTRKG